MEDVVTCHKKSLKSLEDKIRDIVEKWRSKAEKNNWNRFDALELEIDLNEVRNETLHVVFCVLGRDEGEK